MKALEIFVTVCRTALDRKATRRDREAAIALVRMRKFGRDQLGLEGAEKGEQLREAVLLHWDGKAAPDNALIAAQLMREIEALPDYTPPQEEHYWRDRD